MKNLGLIVLAFMLVTNTFNLRTNARIITGNTISTVGNVIHPYRSF